MLAAITLVLVLLTTHLSAQSDNPISAIDWLSQPGLVPLSKSTSIIGDPTIGTVLDEIITIELEGPIAKSYGLIPINISKIPTNFWTDAEPETLTQIIGSLSGPALPAANDLLLRALLAETLGDESVLGVRVRALIDLGAVHAAYSLLGQSQINDFESFALFAETALLSGNIEQMCTQLNSARYLSNDEALQVYCLALEGSWDTAVFNFFTLRTIGAFSPTMSKLLEADLDPELADTLELPQVDAFKLNAIEFTLRASVGKPVATQFLPLKFAPSDLSDATGWKQQIEAAERLGAVGSLPAAKLLEKYQSDRRMASGDVWDRILAVQKLDSALADPIIDPKAELQAFWTLMHPIKLTSPLARAWANKLGKFGVASEGDDILFQMQILANTNSLDFDTTMDRLHALRPQFFNTNYDTLMTHFKKEISGAIPFRSSNVLRAMKKISDGLDGNDTAFLEAIILYRAMGLTTVAQQLAMEFMILAPDR